MHSSNRQRRGYLHPGHKGLVLLQQVDHLAIAWGLVVEPRTAAVHDSDCGHVDLAHGPSLGVCGEGWCIHAQSREKTCESDIFKA